MAVELERSGIGKRRSWGKPRHKEKLVSIDHMDVAELTRQEENTPHSSNPGAGLQHPELMSNQTLIGQLSAMKVAIPVYSDGQPSRERLLYLFRKHVSPQPQRSGVWRRRRRGGNRDVVAMDVDPNLNIWSASPSEDWELPLQRKRKRTEDEDGDSPATKRPEDEACHILANTCISDSVEECTESQHSAAAPKKIIRIRRKSMTNHPRSPVDVPHKKAHVQLQPSPSSQVQQEKITWP